MPPEDSLYLFQAPCFYGKFRNYCKTKKIFSRRLILLLPFLFKNSNLTHPIHHFRLQQQPFASLLQTQPRTQYPRSKCSANIGGIRQNERARYQKLRTQYDRAGFFASGPFAKNANTEPGPIARGH